MTDPSGQAGSGGPGDKVQAGAAAAPALGLNRWCYRVLAYAALMRDDTMSLAQRLGLLPETDSLQFKALVGLEQAEQLGRRFVRNLRH